MIIKDSNNSSSEQGTKILPHDEHFENEIRLSEKLFNQQNIFDERIVNNVLKLNIFIYLMTIIFVIVFTFCSDTIFYMIPMREDEELLYSKLKFSLIDFTQESKSTGKIKNVTNFYHCITNFDNCDESSKCKDVNFKELQVFFGCSCEWFHNFSLAGTIVR